MNTSNLSYSVWGIFENKKKKLLENLKNRLNKKLKSPRFPVHLTISSYFKGKQSEIIAKLKMALKKNKKFFIHTNNYGYKKKIFQSLFIKVKLTNELKTQKMIIDKYLNPRKVSYYPHISLLYGNIPISKKKKLFRV